MNKKALFLLLILVFNSCASGRIKKDASEEYSIKNKAIPIEFGNKNTILICVLRDKKKYNKTLKKKLAENYKGKYICLDRQQIDSLLYTDTAKYRYVFDYHYGSERKKAFYVYDRDKYEEYQSGASFVAYDIAMEAYLQNLEKKRIAYN